MEGSKKVCKKFFSFARMEGKVKQMNVKTLIDGYIREMQKRMDKENIIPSDINSLIILFHPVLVWMISNDNCMEIKSKTLPIIIEGKFRNEVTRKYLNDTVNCGNIIMNTFFKSENKEIITIEIEMTEVSSSYHGVGFCTKEFNEWTQYVWNNGKNHSVVLFHHGWCPTSQEFNYIDEYMVDDSQWVNRKHSKMWQIGDTVMVEMNMKDKKGKIWTKDEPDNMFCIGLPDECTFLVMMGNQNQVITITDIQINQTHSNDY